MIKFSLIFPVYNEEKYIDTLFSNIEQMILEQGSKYEFEVIVVNDGSTDLSEQKLKKWKFAKVVTQVNCGKGMAVRNGSKLATGDYIVVHDADLEYNPFELPKLSKILEANPWCLVYGSRYKNPVFPYIRILPLKNQSLTHSLFNAFLTLIFLFIHKVFVTDLLTAYKIYPISFYKSLNLKTTGFETDHEISISAVKRNLKIIETAISYTPRNKREGKKINAVDGLKAILLILGVSK